MRRRTVPAPDYYLSEICGSGFSFPDLLQKCRYDLEQISYYTIIGYTKDTGIRIFIDGYDTI